MRSRSSLGFVTIFLLFSWTSARAARAADAVPADDSADPATKVQKLNRQGMQLYDELNYAAAEKSLLEALALVEKANLGDGPAGLATNGNLAVLYSSGLRNPTKAVLHFKKALAIKPDLKMGKARSTPETEANLAKAKAEMAGGSPAAGADVEARDESGASVAPPGRQDNPSTVSVGGGDKAGSAGIAGVARDGDEGDEGDEEGEEDEEIDDSNPLARIEKDRWRESQGSKGTMWVALGLGTGFGYADGHSVEAFGRPENHIGFNPGLAFSGLGQCLLEFGYFFGRNTAVSVAYRGQYFLSKGPKGTAIGAAGGLARLLFFSPDEGKMRWYFALVGGAGEVFRFQVDAQVYDKDGQPKGKPVKDTVRGGPYVAGAGGGMLYKLSKRWWWTVDLQALLGFTNVSAVLDFTTGARVQF